MTLDSLRGQHASKVKDNAYTYLLTVIGISLLTLVLLFAPLERLQRADALINRYLFSEITRNCGDR
ncbi:hypothetical protein AHZ37_003870 [Salmonella enterica subsp. indica]|nr:hypothetical protein [Salmonella enterica subsp. arizonae]ECF5888268.1 hypothetical protein [Salmonella enterica subsp. indica]EDN7234209.1 hypothetical protein [Salmonella enterica subsp. enterica]EDR2772674.1 hypothetical protein [Salmonella enterica subsp. enterica serovar Oslo]EDT9221398.1 hypothetical protein [Salmonella enterica subsp. indica]